MIASFHLVHYRGRSWLSGLARVETDRRALRRVDGLRFSRLLLSTPGPPERPVAPPTPHPGRSALLAVWEDEAALETFLRTSPVAERWQAHGKETWHVRLEPRHSHGTCGGENPFEGVRAQPARAEPGVTVTYIDLRPRAAPAFYRKMRHITPDLVRHPGFLAGILMSEPPPHTYLRNFTFSLWASLDQAMSFGYQRPASAHDEARRRSLDEGWHHEMLFARFRPLAAEGTWAGRNPLGGAARSVPPAAGGFGREQGR